MNRKNLTLRKQMLIGILSAFLIIALVSGAIQLYVMKQQIDSSTKAQADALVKKVSRSIEQTELATSTIEQQIDTRLISYSKHIATLLQGKKGEQITHQDLLKIRDQLGLAGITIFQEIASKEDIVGIMATEKQEVGFSLKQFGFYEAGKMLLSDEMAEVPGATISVKSTVVLPIVQSASHTDKPHFFKYAYYHEPGTDYMINPYVKADEVYNLTEKVGPNTQINHFVKENDVVSEIAVLNPKVFVDPTLEDKIYPPLRKVEAGTFNLQTKKDKELLSEAKVKKAHYIETVKGKKIYKMLYPLDENRVVYLALDYGKMSGPLYRQSIIIILSGLISLVVLFLIIVRFFNQVYEKIQKIIAQIKLLESGDLTAKSEINDGTELDRLSKNTNRMADKLNNLVTETQEQATKTQRLSMVLEAEASQSVERMYELSTETTMKAREQLFEITEFLDDAEKVLLAQEENANVQIILAKIETMREIANERTSATTDITIKLSDLLKSLHGQSSELSDISNTLLERMSKFKL